MEDEVVDKSEPSVLKKQLSRIKKIFGVSLVEDTIADELKSDILNYEMLKRLIKSTKKNNENEEWNSWRDLNPSCNIQLNGANLNGLHLCGVNLKGAELLRADLKGANLKGANLSEADLRDAYLRDANLRDANLSETDLSGANLIGTNLNEANLDGEWLCKANLSRADLYEAQLGLVFICEANLRDAKLDRAELWGADLNKADLSGASLQGANLSKAHLKKVNLSGADLYGADLSNANLSGADLSEADFSRANLSEANLSDANLNGADLREAGLLYACLDSANLSGAKLWETQRTNWSIKDIICEYAFFDESSEELKHFSPGEFEKLYAEHTKLVLYYGNGISPIEIATLPALIQALEKQDKYINYQLQSIINDAGGASVTFAINGASNNEPSKLNEMATKYQTLHRELSQEIELKKQYKHQLDYATLFLEKAMSNGNYVFHGSVNAGQIGNISDSTLTNSQTIYNQNDLSTIKDIVKDIQFKQDELKQSFSKRDLSELLETIEKLVTQINKPNSDHPFIQSAINSLKSSFEKATTNVLTKGWLEALSQFS